MERIGLIALGGALGTLLRHGCVLVGERWALAGIPLAVLVVNVLGSFAAGCLMTFAASRAGTSENLRLFAMVGVLGGFTTFSAFTWENLELARSGCLGRAAIHALLHVSLALCAVFVGAWAARSALG